jgi:hypothetical protein
MVWFLCMGIRKKRIEVRYFYNTLQPQRQDMGRKVINYYGEGDGRG